MWVSFCNKRRSISSPMKIKACSPCKTSWRVNGSLPHFSKANNILISNLSDINSTNYWSFTVMEAQASSLLLWRSHCSLLTLLMVTKPKVAAFSSTAAKRVISLFCPFASFCVICTNVHWLTFTNVYLSSEVSSSIKLHILV